MKKFCFLCCLAAALFLMPGCSRLRDGKYDGRSTDDSRGAYGIVSLEVRNGKIAAVEFLQYNADGTMKDEAYGRETGEENYEMAQKVLEHSEEYARKLVETQDVEKVDVITGSTTSWKQFKEAARDALAKAK